MNSFFSILIPTYNRAHLISKTLISVLNQTHKNFEVIIVDDGSTDNTMQVVQAVISQYNLTNFHYYLKENEERAAARNYGSKLAKGDYVNFVDSDDILLSNHLAEALKVVADLNEPEVFHLNYAWVSPNLNLIKSVYKREAIANNTLINGNNLSCNGVFIRKDIINKIPFNETRELSASEDWQLWLRLSSRYKIHMLPTVTSYIVNHDQRSVNQFDEHKIIKRRDSLIKTLSQDEVFLEKYPNGLKKISSHMNSYLALHASLNGVKFKTIKYFLLSICQDYKTLFKRRSLAIFKHLIFN
jgi:glycosyltransferase involved in cell wall biosynthesis